MTEKDFEDILCKYPDLIEEHLTFKGRQIRVYDKIMDILFEDKFKDKLIVELKIGSIDRKHIGQVMEYEGSILSIEEPTARIMLIGNRVPPNLKKALDFHGIEWKELSFGEVRKFLETKKDLQFLSLLEDMPPEPPLQTTQTKVQIKHQSSSINRQPRRSLDVYNVDDIISIIVNAETRKQLDIIRTIVKGFGEDVKEYCRKGWVEYRRRKVFFEISAYRNHLIVCIRLPKADVEQSMFKELDIRPLKDTHYIKVKVNENTNLNLVLALVERAYKIQSRY